jgi:hypothetical protein
MVFLSLQSFTPRRMTARIYNPQPSTCFIIQQERIASTEELSITDIELI